ncbi:hypothetical protein NDK47_13375 [Brevibacillus ruminantium]|uniref:Gingipain propeptide domain-containing protein n=1 Tax=Brevibacillus ruminantium TaxID=2950604 RepID=A0ABY4WMD3_9BACL|nr:hypothetical protein [Brevibacillus ruminantium]USG68208.1 hypothetical protein NDK47_13375 [Brevibacillus ruminantium]
MWKKHVLIIAIWLSSVVAAPVSATPEIGDLQVDPTRVANGRELIVKSDLIILGWPNQSYQTFETGGRIGQRRIVNFVQTVRVEKVLKGHVLAPVKLMSTGVEPLPDPADPVNMRYPGPLAAEQYVLFLKKVSGSDLYSTVGLWQGVYPVYDGKMISLRNLGFTELNQITMRELEEKIKVIHSAAP